MNNFFIEPPAGLLEKILNRIHSKERLFVLRRIIVFSVLLVGSLFALIPSFKILAADLGQSGFIHFFSLLFSDFSYVTAYWQSFTMILLETLPALSLVLCLALLVILLQSAKSLTKNIKIISKREHRQFFSVKSI